MFSFVSRLILIKTTAQLFLSERTMLFLCLKYIFNKKNEKKECKYFFVSICYTFESMFYAPID